VGLAVVGQSAIDGQRPIELLCRDHACQLMGEGQRPQRQRRLRALEDRGRQSLRPADDERSALRRLLFPVQHTRCEVNRRKRTAAEIERDQAIAFGDGEDPSALPLPNLERRAPIQWLILDLDHVELRELGRPQLVVRGGFGQRAPRLADDDKPERDYASG